MSHAEPPPGANLGANGRGFGWAAVDAGGRLTVPARHRRIRMDRRGCDSSSYGSEGWGFEVPPSALSEPAGQRVPALHANHRPVIAKSRRALRLMSGQTVGSIALGSRGQACACQALQIRPARRSHPVPIDRTAMHEWASDGALSPATAVVHRPLPIAHTRVRAAQSPRLANVRPLRRGSCCCLLASAHQR